MVPAPIIIGAGTKYMNKTLIKFRNLFPEEGYFFGLRKNQNIRFSDKNFEERFTKFLEFYEKNLFNLPEEKLMRKVNENTYRLIKGEETGSEELDVSKINYLEKIKNFDEWMENLYGLRLINKEEMIGMIRKIRNEMDGYEDNDEKVVEVNIIELREYFETIFAKLGLVMPKAEWRMVPDSMSELVPVAAAYWTDRLTDDGGKLVVYINKRPMSRSRMLVVTAHEVFGHLYHYDLVRKHCFDLSKRLPVMNRFSLTEGVAMMAEEKFAEISNDVRISKMVLRGKLLRCVRYLF